MRKVSLSKPVLSAQEKNIVKKHRDEIKSILTGKDDRFLLIVGPCSAWPEKATFEYAKRLKALQNELENLKLVMRVYTQKPRTNLGWKGLAVQPDPCKDEDIKKGVKEVQKLMQKIVALDLAIADEALFLPITHYYEDFLSYVALGARSSEDQEHRNYGATRNFAVGVKNPSSGDEQVAINSVLATRASATFYLEREYTKSDGNSFSHLILRGGRKPNYKEKDIKSHLYFAEKAGIKDLSIIIDTNHANSRKDHKKQIDIAKYVLKLKKKDESLNKHIRGLMIESFIKDGRQDINCKWKMDQEGLSITDHSLSWEDTEKLIQSLHKMLLCMKGVL